MQPPRNQERERTDHYLSSHFDRFNHFNFFKLLMVNRITTFVRYFIIRTLYFVYIFSFHVFCLTPNMNTRFLQPLKIYTVVGILLALNDAVVIILGISLNKNTWHVNYTDYFQNDTFMFYLVHIFFTIWSIVYTFGGNIYTAKLA